MYRLQNDVSEKSLIYRLISYRYWLISYQVYFKIKFHMSFILERTIIRVKGEIIFTDIGKKYKV